MRKILLAVFVILATFLIFRTDVQKVSACNVGSSGACSGACGNIGLRCQGNPCGCENVYRDCSGTCGLDCGGASCICNHTTGNWACNAVAPGCTQWSGWSPCSGGYQQRECQAGSGATQQRACTEPTNPPNTGSPPQPTDTPVPPTATPFLRVRTFNPELTPVASAPNHCKASCASAPCTLSGCQANVDYVDYPGALTANQGGGLSSSSIVVLGVTPVTNGAVDASGTYSANCRGAGAGNYCYYWPTALNTGSRVVRYIVATPTPTNTPTPTPGPWVKLKDTSYVSTSGIINRIPLAPVAYDTSDTNQPYYIVGETGVCMAPTIDMTSINTNAKTGNPEYRAIYTPAPYAMTSTAFSGYVKARKEYKTITSLTEITANGLYEIAGNLNLTSVPAQFNQYDVVIIVGGTITIDMASFLPTRSVALVGNSLTMTNTVTQARGIFVADSISLGNANQGLKITGNLISQSGLTNNRISANPNIQSLYVVFDPAIYLDVLPYLSTANYEWKQLQ